ncbi:MAG: glycolate oxidase subunit GlcF [Alcaligenes sp.]
MQTHLTDWARQLPRAEEAQAILRSCVHCGFCNATCPTYLDQGNELDGPRGRIYLIKMFLEGEATSELTQHHLDRCLSCRNCETTCPSGVKYHALLDIGRSALEPRVQRPLKARAVRVALARILPEPGRVQALLGAARAARPFLPDSLKEKIPQKDAGSTARPAPRHERRVLMLEGCVQPAMAPSINAATARVLDRLGISVTPIAQAGCCGASSYHLGAQEQGLEQARRNIDAWWPQIEQGALAIVQTASGCGAFVKEYADLFKDDPVYAEKARRVSELARDLVEVLEELPLETCLDARERPRLAFHCPCTLQHAQKLGGRVEAVLTRLGFELGAVPDGHLCCGSAGTYSLTEPDIARRLRDRKLDALESSQPDVIATANMACGNHLNSAGRTRVRHWIELVDEHLAAPA